MEEGGDIRMSFGVMGLREEIEVVVVVGMRFGVMGVVVMSGNRRLWLREE